MAWFFYGVACTFMFGAGFAFARDDYSGTAAMIALALAYDRLGAWTRRRP